jgi:glutamine amidotransferase
MACPGCPPPAQVGGGGRFVGVVDYGMGNRRSVEKALEHVGARVVLTATAHCCRSATDWSARRRSVSQSDGEPPRARLDDFIVERAAGGTPVLGICLGMQLAFERSSEHGGADGLGIVPGEVRELAPGKLKLPHIGWSEVRWERATPLLDGVPAGRAYYHVHSLIGVPADPADTLGTAEYGERFVTAVSRGSFTGVQFHPEKSSLDGLRLLANFVATCVPAA